MDSGHLSNEYLMQKTAEYKAKFEPLFAYIPYFTKMEGEVTRSVYEGEGLQDNSVPVPVFDSTVLSFVKEAQRTGLMDRNYVYKYSKYRMKNSTDERMMISSCQIRDIDTIVAIMSKYVLGGMTKGILWSEAVREGIWLHCLVKVKELVSVYEP